MKAWGAAATMAAVLATGVAGAATDNARPRGGSSGSSGGAGARHHSGGGGSSSSGSSSSSSSSSSDSSSSSHTSRPPTGAQLRHPRAGTGTGYRHNHGSGYYYPSYYDPYYYGFYPYGWYSPYYWGYYPGYYGYAAGYGPSGSQGYGGSSARAGQLRVQVQPSGTRVYVDGYYAGVADDFDGLFQRLNVSAGAHDISLRLEGYRTFNVKVYVPLDGTIKLQHKMQRGAGEENAGVIGEPMPDPREEEREPADDRDPDYGDERGPGPGPGGEGGLVRLEVRPADASVYVDGEFRGTGRELQQLRLPPGRHRIEVVRPGYRTVERDVELAPGQTLDIGVVLDRG